MGHDVAAAINHVHGVHGMHLNQIDKKGDKSDALLRELAVSNYLVVP